MGGHLYHFFVRTLTEISRLFTHVLHILIKKVSFSRDTDGSKSKNDPPPKPKPKPGDDPDSGEGQVKTSLDQEISTLV